ncbi:MAG TPA: hypothetical protein PL048_20525, partial [Leptospiraceae bacterium]|nr:hypothetical protein [Leptospiraceae bacterium]
GSRLFLYSNGKIEYAVLSENTVIQGIPCKSQEWVGFYQNGRLKQAVLSEDIQQQGHHYKSGETVKLDIAGRLAH